MTSIKTPITDTVAAQNYPIAPGRGLSDGQAQALAQMREFLEDCWRWSHHVHYDTGFRRSEPKPEIAATFMCRHTAKFLLELITPIDPGWRLAGGTMTTNDGREPQPHWWIENDDTIVDLTSDQFGWDSITVVPVDDARYVRQPHACHKRWINGLGTVISQWKGQTSRDWMESHPQFQAIAARCDDVHRTFGRQWKAGMGTTPMHQVSEPSSNSRPR